MSVAMIARRYASALFELHQESGIDRDALCNAVLAVSDADVVRVIESPSIDKAAKATLVKSVLKSAKPDAVSRLVDLLASRNKLSLLPEILVQFEALLAQASREVQADVTVATELDKRERDSLAKALKSMFGGEVTLNITQDSSILGGLVIQVGDRKVDCSLRGKLNGLRRAIVS